MKYEYLGNYPMDTSLGGTMEIGPKSEWLSINVDHVRLPRGVEYSVFETERGDDVMLMLALKSEKIKEAGTFGFVVSSPKPAIESTTYLFQVTRHAAFLLDD